MTTLEILRDIAIVLLVIEAFVLSLIPAAILFLCVRGMSWVLRQVRTSAPAVQGYFSKAAGVADQVSQRIAGPVIAVSARASQMKRMRSALFAFFKV
jgi:hypothetical protein